MVATQQTLRITLLLTAAAALSACASGASRPEAATGGEAIGGTYQCSEETVGGDHDHFIVDWSDGNRAALESAMSRGVAVVKFTCDGVEVLKACKATGEYGYNAVSPKEQVVSMKDAGDIAANFGGVPQFPAEISAELAQGRQLDLAYKLVGTYSTDVYELGAADLEGRCDGATHFVFEAQLGAFVMETAEQGHAAAAAEMLEYGSASASNDSERAARMTDGDTEACGMTSEGDMAPTDGCKAMLRANLLSIR